MKAKIFAIFNHKGGVAKTTSAINLAINLAILNQKVLLIDFDPSANTSLGLGIYNPKILKSLFSVYLKQTKIKKIILKGVCYDVDLIGAKTDLVNINNGNQNKANWFSDSLQEVKQEYDFIIIDCPPGFNEINKLILKSINNFIIPIQPEFFALNSLFKVLRLMKLKNEINNQKTQILGILLTIFDQRNNLSKNILSKVKTIFKDNLLKTIIYKNVKLAEASAFGKPINIYNKSANFKNDYFLLAQEILHKYE